MRNVNCPTEIIDQVGGCSNNYIGQTYGNGYTINKINTFMKQI